MVRMRWTLVPLLAAMLGCGQKPQAKMDQKPPEVVTCQPVTKEVTDFEDFTGRIASVGAVDIRARVSGYLQKVLFKEGTEVKKDDPLFEIDPRTYQADLDRTEATVAQARARLKRLESEYKRATELLPKRAISQTDFEQASGDRDEAKAALMLAEAVRDQVRLNLGWTRVLAPQSGRISRQMIDPGNLVKADDTVLTSIVALDPVYVYFDLDERTMLRVRRQLRAGQVASTQDAGMTVLLGLADEDGFPHAGTINFEENRVDAMSGTLRLRGMLANPQRIFSPGMFVRVRVPIGKAHQAILVSERALGTDQGQSYVCVVDDKNEVSYRPVKIGALQDGLRVVEQGLGLKERIILSGLQRVRPGAKVTPKPEKDSPGKPAVAPVAKQ